MSVPTNHHMQEVAKKDRLARAIKRFLRDNYTVDGLCNHIIPSKNLDGLRRALDLSFPKEILTPTQRKIIRAFNSNR